MEAFFNLIHPSILLFERTEFFRDFDSGLVSYKLCETVAAITLVILRPRSDFPLSNAFEYLDYHLKATEGITHQDGSLDGSLRECLLAYYCFHSCPDRKAWLRIGNLAREAYSFGLHQLDNAEPSLTFEKRSHPENVDAWRRIWWIVFQLDSYSNLSAATPLVVELQSISTAIKVLPNRSSDVNNRSLNGHLLFLANDVSTLWETAQALTRYDPTNHANFHIV